MDSQDLTPNVGTPEENKVVDSSNVNAETPAVAEEQVEKPAVAEEQVEKPAVVEEQMEAAPEAVEEAPVPEPAVVETPQAADEPAVDEPKANEAEEKAAEEPKVYNTKGEVLQRVIELAHGEEVPDKKEVDLLKTIFYKLHSAEREAAEKAYLEAGGDPESYQVTPDEQEEKFKAEMALIKERRSKAFQEQENEKAENLKRKLEIIEKVKGMVDSPESANKAYPEFKRLQQEWKEIKAVPAERASELWKTYQHYVEQFYDQLRLNIEAREYDFRKNLEIKTKICEAAEKLAEETDVISAFHQLQELHQQYREAGPVAKDLREEVWTRFKAASSVINKRHQQHFEELR